MHVATTKKPLKITNIGDYRMIAEQENYMDRKEAKEIVLATGLYKTLYLPLGLRGYKPLMIPSTSTFIPAYLANLEDLLLLATLANGNDSIMRIRDKYADGFTQQAYLHYGIRSRRVPRENALTTNGYSQGMSCLLGLCNYLRGIEGTTPLPFDKQGIKTLRANSLLAPVIILLQTEINRQKATPGYTIFKLTPAKYWRIVRDGVS